MQLPGIILTVLAGLGVPRPVDAEVLDALDEVQIRSGDSGRSGFQLSFASGRPAGSLDHPLLQRDQFRPGSRVIVVATVAGQVKVLSDGVVTTHQLSPSTEPGASKLTVTGEDVSAFMDLHELRLPYPGMSDFTVAMTIIARYAWLGLIPAVIPPVFDRFRSPIEGTPQRNGTDREVLERMAEAHGYIFHVRPGPVPGTNTAYWGPPIRAGIPQRALTFGMDSAGNLASISFQADATKPKFVYGLVQDATTQASIPIVGMRLAQPMAGLPAIIANLPFVGSKQVERDEGGDVMRVFGKATAEHTRSSDAAATASGELDVLSYGGVLEAGKPVDVRGVGLSMDGTWYVKSVTHSIRRGRFTQSFNLEREGILPLIPVARV